MLQHCTNTRIKVLVVQKHFHFRKHGCDTPATWVLQTPRNCPWNLWLWKIHVLINSGLQRHCSQIPWQLQEKQVVKTQKGHLFFLFCLMNKQTRDGGSYTRMRTWPIFVSGLKELSTLWQQNIIWYLKELNFPFSLTFRSCWAWYLELGSLRCSRERRLNHLPTTRIWDQVANTDSYLLSQGTANITTSIQTCREEEAIFILKIVRY